MIEPLLWIGFWSALIAFIGGFLLGLDCTDGWRDGLKLGGSFAGMMTAYLIILWLSFGGPILLLWELKHPN